MIDTKELRRLAQAALIGPDGFSMRWLKLLQDFQEEANPSVICELLDRLEVAEKEVAHIKEVEFPRKASAVAVGWETKCARLEQERDALLGRIEATEELVRELQRNLSSGMWRVLREENEALRTKIEAMEQQVLVGTLHDDGHFVWSATRPYESNYAGWKMKLYALPGAKGE